jgi:hypothetical protein
MLFWLLAERPFMDHRIRDRAVVAVQRVLYHYALRLGITRPAFTVRRHVAAVSELEAIA